MQDKWWKISNILVMNGRKGKERVTRKKELPGGSLVVARLVCHLGTDRIDNHSKALERTSKTRRGVQLQDHKKA